MIVKYISQRFYKILLIAGFAFYTILVAQEAHVIPKPQSIVVSGGALEVGTGCRVMYSDNSLQASAEALADFINRITGVSLSVASGSAGAGDIGLAINSSLANEEYNLTVGTNVEIEGRDIRAVMRGAATFLQIIPQDLKIPKVTISDKPDSEFRGISLDVARKYHSIDELKQMVDVCFFYKIVHMGLHLTDDQNIMFPSTEYPDLDNYNDHGKPAYTIAELEELEAYAAARGVFIYCELDVPGHSGKLRQAYPSVFGELSGGVDITSSTCRNALKTIITEMCDIFASGPYFHIGCDESGAVGHSYFPTFFNEMNSHIKSEGKNTLVWEASYAGASSMDRDILVIAWESSYYRPDQLLQDGFTVINGSWDPLYQVEHYPWVQFTIQSQERLYSFDKYTFSHVADGYPASNPITVSSSSDVPGALMCWWEGRGINAVPILRHNLAAMSCALWNKNDESDFNDFEQRYEIINTVMEKLLFPVSMASYDLINDYFKPSQQFAFPSITVTMSAVPEGSMRYTTNGNDPTSSSNQYTNPIAINNTTTVKAVLFDGSNMVGHIHRITFHKIQQDRTNLTYGKPVTSNASAFITLPPSAVVDGVVEKDSYWSAYTSPSEWNSNKAWITIDLERAYDINKITVFAAHPNSGYAEYYKIDVSTNNSNWTTVVNNANNSSGTTGVDHSFSSISVRYIRLTTLGNTMFPNGHYCRIIEIRASGTNTKKPALVAYNGRKLSDPKPPLQCYRLSGAGSYKVMYADNSGFNNAVEKDMSDTVYIPDNDLTSGMWFWKVSSNLDFENYSAVDSFIVETTPITDPYTFATNPSVTFLNTQKGVSICIDGYEGKNAVLKIFDVKGRLVAVIKPTGIQNGSLFWNYQNSSGHRVGAGMYILRLGIKSKVYIHKLVMNR